MNSLKSYLENKKMVIVVGTGGVGKTSIAASLGLQAAQMGKKTIVLTIDPAKRLAQTFGIQKFDHKPKDIFIQKGVKLSAMMLDTQQTFDSLVQKYAPSKEVSEKILSNRIYQFVSTMMAGTQEYMALEKLYELNEEKKYDLIVLDTPPSKHALSFIQAPDRLSHFLDENILKWFLKPAGTWSLKILTSGSHVVLKVIEKLTGLELLYDLSEFLLNLQSLYGGFRERTLKAKDILKSKDSLFVLVTNPEKTILEQGILFHKKLTELKVEPGCVIMNRITREIILDPHEKQVLKELNPAQLDFFEKYQNLALREKSLIKQFKNKIASQTPICEIPFFEKDIHDIKGLQWINLHLFK